MEIFQFALPNGIRCVHRRVKSAVAYCGLMVNAGSRDEKPEEYGLAHFIEHALFKGTQKRKAYHINNRLENLGGELNAYTTKEETVVHATTLKGDFSKAAELISDLVFHSTFPPKEIEREKEIIYDEINSYKDSPSERIFDDYEDLLSRGSELGHNILGNKKAIKRSAAPEIRAFLDRTYNTDQMVFSAVGNFSERRFREVCERYLAPVQENRRRFTRCPALSAQAFHSVQHKNTHQAHCLLGTRAYDHRNPNRIALSLLVNMLGGPSANSILNVAIREKNGLSYNIEAGYVPFGDTGIATVYFGTERENVDKCMELIRTELKKIVSGGITPRQLSVARKQFLGQLYISGENNEGNMLSMAKSSLVYGRAETTERIVPKIETLTVADLTEVAAEIFGGELSVLVYQ